MNIAKLPDLLERTHGEPISRTNQGSQKNDSVRQSLLTADRFFREVMATQKEPKTAKPPVERKPTALRSSPIAPLLGRQSLGVEVASRRPLPARTLSPTRKAYPSHFGAQTIFCGLRALPDSKIRRPNQLRNLFNASPWSIRATSVPISVTKSDYAHKTMNVLFGRRSLAILSN